MQDTTSREKILKKIRKALNNKGIPEYGDVNFDSGIYLRPDEAPEIEFAKRFSEINGKFIFCENEKELQNSLSILIAENNWTDVFSFEPRLKDLLGKAGIRFNGNETEIIKANIGITLCECLVARTGSVLISSRQASGRRLPVYSNIHLVVAYSSQLVSTMQDGLKFIQNKYRDQFPSMVAAISGPSRTADIEKTLVQGAHGPKEIYVLLTDDNQTPGMV